MARKPAPGPGQQQIPGADWHEGDFPRSEHFAAGAHAYREAQGMAHPTASFAGVRTTPPIQHAIGRMVQGQEGTPQHMSPQLASSYAALHAGVESQYQHLTTPEAKGGMGVSVEVSAEDPYSTPHEMLHDVNVNKRLKVMATDTAGSGNIAMPNEINDKFRAVHDAFGHIATGRNFSRHGEEAAVQHHASMFPKEAHPALMSELRGQTSGLIVGGGNFPENRPYELPKWTSKVRPKAPSTPRLKPAGVQQGMF